MRDHARVPTRRLRTANYSDKAKKDLGDAFAKAREAAGYKSTAAFARAARIKSVASLEMLENGKPGVGQSILFAVGRFMPGWTEDTPRQILEGELSQEDAVQAVRPSAEVDTVNPVLGYEESANRPAIGSPEWLIHYAEILQEEDFREVREVLLRMLRAEARVLELQREVTERALTRG
jgi:hypothetical protein